MEGVVDYTLRALLTQLGGIDRCVTEFIRVSNAVLPKRVFYRYSPELKQGGTTKSGVPVYVQLLGCHPELMAENAIQALACGAPGIDINFGCPSKTVNNSLGGAALLKTPQRLYDITQAVRQAIPSETPVTVKIRLGYHDSRLFTDIVQAIQAAHPNELVIHARTKADGYKPPAHWYFLKDVQANSPIPIIANGEVWNEEDYRNCIVQSGCQDIMIGRGILAKPDLPMRIKQMQKGLPVEVMHYKNVTPLLLSVLDHAESTMRERFVGNPVKQWLVYLKKGYPEFGAVFDEVKRLHNAGDIRNALIKHLPS